MMMGVLDVIGVVILYQVVLTTGQDGPTVDTIYGTVRGVGKQDAQGRDFEDYLGVPFAAPPVGDLRWTKPVPPNPWDGVWDATKYGDHCVHFIANFYPLIGLFGNNSEDCLFVNVHVPHGVDALGDTKLPVMVYVYGGIFIIGTGAMYPGDQLALDGEVIVVTLNYRVGVLGWMSTADENSPGNYGLWDMAAALQWVQDNIEQFAGDKDRVTVFGQSAGGASVSHLMISKQSNTLFHRAIAISGGSTAIFATVANDILLSITRSLGIPFVCLGPTTGLLVQCLRGKDAKWLDLISLGSPLVLNGYLPEWIPTIDGDFVHQEPRLSWEAGEAGHLDFMTGHTIHDGAGFVYLDFLGMGGNRNAMANNIFEGFVKLILQVFPNPEEKYQAIENRYPGITSPDLATRTDAGIMVATDWLFASSPRLEADLHSKTAAEGKSTYMYQFEYRQTFQEYTDPRVTGSHLDDLYAVFGDVWMEPFRQRFYANPDFSEDDRTVNQYINSYYANFAYTGNPNEGPHAVPVQWEQYNTIDRPYLVESPSPAMNTLDPVREEKYRWWIEEFPNVRQGTSSTTDSIDIVPKMKDLLSLLAQMLPSDQQATNQDFNLVEEVKRLSTLFGAFTESVSDSDIEAIVKTLGKKLFQ